MLEVTIIGGGMITHDQLMPSLYHMQRLGRAPPDTPRFAIAPEVSGNAWVLDETIVNGAALAAV